MKVKIANLGAVEKAEIDLKPLTVFIGGNGTGKTWTAYTLASIFGRHGFDRYWKSYVNNKTQNRYPIIDNAIEKFLQEGNVNIDLIRFVDEYTDIYINDVAQLSPIWMKQFLSTESIDFKKMQISFDLSTTKHQIIENIRKSNIERKFSFGSQGEEYLSIIKELDEIYIYFNLVSKKDILKTVSKKLLREILVQEVFQIIHRAFYSYVYIFPTERTTFITFPFFIKKEVIKRENSNIAISEISEPDIEQIISEQENRQRSKKPSEPIQNLISILANAYIKTSDEREEEICNSPEIAIYIELAKLLEEHILQGRIDFNQPGLEKEIIFQPSDNIKLEISVTSSMIKELAPLVLCLRYLAEPDELLIIDEPEMNLHPVAQVEIIEFLAMLVQSGLKVLITTHSPYIVEHLSNLMKAAKYEDKENIKKRFYLERTEAFIPQENVSVYLFENGTAKNILNEKGRIDWGTFGDVSDDISHIFP
ncbi:AAA family ATPase [Anabaena sp. CCY 9910]|uniref:AAA family ATPase n=1 Tax=Anabaena sp. CCY 9910 TaxID=3103870 RepID=UPI0039E00511